MTIRRCAGCGAISVSIPKIEELHRAIARVLILKPTSLAPVEIKFLRKYLGWSGADFAAHMGGKLETISRWENGKLAMSAAADRLLRTMVAMRAPVQSYSLDVLKDITPKKDGKPLRIGLRLDATGWEADAA